MVKHFQKGIDATVRLSKQLVEWKTLGLNASRREFLKRRLLFTVEGMARKEKSNHEIRQIFWEDSKPFCQSVLVELETSDQALVRFNGVTPFCEEELFGKFFTHLFENTDLVFLLTEAEPVEFEDHRVLFANKAFEKMTGYANHEILGQSPRHLQGEDTEPSARAEIRRGLREWRNIRVQLTNHKKSGEPYQVELEIQPVADEFGWYEYWLSVQKDITAEESRKNQHAQMQKLESLGRLSASIAHEMNTPLHFIGTNIEYLGKSSEHIFNALDLFQDLLQKQTEQLLLEDSTSFQEIAKLHRLDHIREQIPLAISDCEEGIRRTTTIVRSMRAYSHPGTGSRDLVDIGQLIDGCISISRGHWKHVAEVTANISPNLEPAYLYESDLHQVFVNLIVNASDAIRERFGETLEGRISIDATDSDGHLVIEVRDNGTGMPDHVKEKIFDPFFTTKEIGKGTGQGLAIVHGVISGKHGGTIELESEAGVGTLFRLKIPCPEPAATENQLKESATLV